jgi:phosphoribosylanthranilate isomerase
MTRTRIKFCGVTRAADAELCAELGVDAVGLNFYPKSPRCVTPQVGAELVKQLGPLVCPVGVFVNAPPIQMLSVAEYAGLRALQTYSDAPPEFDFGQLGWLPAFRVKDEAGIAAVRHFLGLAGASPSRSRPAAVVIDSFVPGEMGGTGHVAPWHLLAGLDLGVPLILAGGLTPDNVADAIRQVRPWGVDLASGIESAPGVKDAGKMRVFVTAVRDADAG